MLIAPYTPNPDAASGNSRNIHLFMARFIRDGFQAKKMPG
jgi:hypothetical protein